MADILTNVTNLSNLVPNYYSKRLLERLEPNCRLYQLAEKKRIPANSGRTIIWNRYTQLDNGTQLTEGTPIGPSAMSTTVVSATLLQYGNLVKITDMVDMTAISDVVKDAVDVLGDNAAATIDGYISGTVLMYGSCVGAAAAVSATVVSYGFPAYFSVTTGVMDGVTWGGVVSAATVVALPLTLSGVRKAVTHLRTLNVPPHEDGFYHAVASPVVLDQLRGDTGWASWNQYARPEKMERGLVGEVEGVKFYDDPNILVNMSEGVLSGALSTTLDTVLGVVYPTLVFGKGAYAVTELESSGTGENATRVYVVPRESADKSDPLQQFSYVGYKATLAAKILNASCGVIIVANKA